MPSYTVVQADHKKDFSGNRGQMSVYSLVLQDETGQSETCELCQMQKTPPPQPGQTLEGHIEPNKNPDFAPSFKKDYGGSGGFSGSSGGSKGGGTFKPRDPSEIAGARHAHNLLVAANCFQPLPLDATNQQIEDRVASIGAFARMLDEETKGISDAAKTEKKDSDVPF